MKEKIVLKLLEMLIDSGQSKESVENNTENTNIENDVIGKYCIIRTYSAGVYFGKIEKLQENIGILSDAVIIHSWSGDKTKTTLCLSKHIPNKSVNLGEKAETVYLSNIISVIPCADDVIKFYKSKM